MTKRIGVAALTYLAPTFALGFVWHLVLFKSYYDTLAIYRADLIIPFGFLSMSIQAVLFAWIYDLAFAGRARTFGARALAYAAFGATLSWSFTTIAVAAKNVMSSVPDYVAIETAFGRSVDHRGAVDGAPRRRSSGVRDTSAIESAPSGLRAAGDPEVASFPAALHGLRLIVVDDEPDARELLATILVHAGASRQPLACRQSMLGPKRE